VLRGLVSWPFLVSVLFIAAVAAITLIGETTLGYSIGQRIEQPIYAQVDFQVRDEQQTEADKKAARAATPSYYSQNAPALTFDRIRADLMRLYQAAVDAETVEEYTRTLEELEWPADARGYERLRSLAHGDGRARYQGWVDGLSLDREYVAEDWLSEPRDPKSVTKFILLEVPGPEGNATAREVFLSELVNYTNERMVQRSAAAVARTFPVPELRPTVEKIVAATFKDAPTIVFNKERTDAEMKAAEEARPPVMAVYARGKPFIHPGVIGSKEYALLQAHHAKYLEFLKLDSPEAAEERKAQALKRVGAITLVAILSAGLLAYARLHRPRIFQVRARTLAFSALILACLLAARALDMKWPEFPELVYAPCLFSASVLAIVYPRRLAIGIMCLTAIIVTTLISEDVFFLLALLTGIAVAGHQLEEVRSRTKLISSGFVAALALMIASTAGGLAAGHSMEFFKQHVPLAGGCAIAAAFVVSGVLPFIERMFRIATSLTLLEWRDPTRPLLQLLAREAPGTYNHSLLVGTLAEAACERIGANGLLAQVGALYHDIGKAQKADYFAENQEGQISRHDNLAPTMSLLIILGHVKDGIEMAKEYKLPRVLHQFIDEHHGTTVVRYFHHMASEKQPQIASGKHDREVPEAEFRYPGPKPRSRESAVLMLCDAVEGAVRALSEPTPGRIESVVHQAVTGRLNDGQCDDCDITLREIRQVEDSLVKRLCASYHGRGADPKARKAADDEASQRKRVSV